MSKKDKLQSITASQNSERKKLKPIDVDNLNEASSVTVGGEVEEPKIDTKA